MHVCFLNVYEKGKTESKQKTDFSIFIQETIADFKVWFFEIDVRIKIHADSKVWFLIYKRNKFKLKMKVWFVKNIRNYDVCLLVSLILSSQNSA